MAACSRKAIRVTLSISGGSAGTIAVRSVSSPGQEINVRFKTLTEGRFWIARKGTTNFYEYDECHECQRDGFRRSRSNAGGRFVKFVGFVRIRGSISDHTIHEPHCWTFRPDQHLYSLDSANTACMAARSYLVGCCNVGSEPRSLRPAAYGSSGIVVACPSSTCRITTAVIGESNSPARK